MNIKHTLKKASSIAVLGCGEVGRAIVRNLSANPELAGRKFLLFDSDESKRGLTIDGGTVHVLSELPKLAPDVVILGFNGEKRDYQAAGKRVLALQATKIVTALEVFEGYPEIRGWPLREVSYYREREDDFRKVADRLADAESRRQYLGFHAWAARKTGAKPPEGQGKDQYFCRSIVGLLKNEVVVDCGAFRGDTLASFLEHSKGRFAEYYAFEPDRNNFGKLAASVQQLAPGVRDKVYLLNMAILDRTRYVSFQAEAAQYSRVGGGNEVWVQGTSIDDFAFRKAPTFVKFDLEGQDLKALYGALVTIRQHRPILCVAIYHNPEDLLDIPQMLACALPGYRFYTRAHSRFAFDFVLYCVPEERALKTQPKR